MRALHARKKLQHAVTKDLQGFGSMFKQESRYTLISVQGWVNTETFLSPCLAMGSHCPFCTTSMKGVGSAQEEIIVPSDDSHEAVLRDPIMKSTTSGPLKALLLRVPE